MRPSQTDYFLSMAQLVSTRSTCLRRAVGCVLVNGRGHVIATGYNGNAAGQRHCNEMKLTGADYTSEGVVQPKSGEVSMRPLRMIETYPHACAGATAPSGTQLESCEAIHAEQNALLQCRDVFSIVTCYVTHSPCITCVKLLLNTSCQRIIFRERYAHDAAAHELWMKSDDVDREWILHPGEPLRAASSTTP